MRGLRDGRSEDHGAMGTVIVIVGLVLLYVGIVAMAEQQVAGGKRGEKIGYGCAFSLVAALVVTGWVASWAFPLVLGFLLSALH
jgi:hypothetical protein